MSITSSISKEHAARNALDFAKYTLGDPSVVGVQGWDGDDFLERLRATLGSRVSSGVRNDLLLDTFRKLVYDLPGNYGAKAPAAMYWDALCLFEVDDPLGLQARIGVNCTFLGPETCIRLQEMGQHLGVKDRRPAPTIRPPWPPPVPFTQT
jgi:hypothetical protein